MSTIQRVDPESQNQADGSDGEQENEFKPLTREEAQQWRASQPRISLWRLVGVQLLVGLSSGALAWLFTQSASVAWSVLYGAAAVVLPSALMAYGLTSSALSRLLAGYAQAAFAGFLLWEGVKILLVVAMLWSAPWIVPELNWLGLLAGLVLVLKVYWFGFWIQTRRANLNG
ncbi:MAG: ATP synthase subunit I [Hydrogenophaga sp.]|jgi:ATP synthase protein I|uniref:ATP synthase subunit I n=1 Tax=Hydrogenophaga sp. TaxID=1904254 RepID=UPI002730FD8E|nr:ATP synthase subunit I [Hydrogenophaga sp.]MDP2250783.1 ATP synthase subunit I [Hydrogenophaga sp.]MDZ4130679.1 ATP synthase subunit I [Hydrogenophaga sp.]MDZ4400379.1 ATP synthase subunit I [Hydrogenophaga sp.]